MSTVVCSRELVRYLPGAQDVRGSDGPLPELSGIWLSGDCESDLPGAAAIVRGADGLGDFIAWASERGAAAVIGCGVGAAEFPQSAALARISLIAWPDASPDLSEARFAVQDALLRAQREQIERSRVIHDRLTRVAVDGRGLADLMTTLAMLVDAPAILKDRRHRNLADANPGTPLDDVRLRALANGGTTGDVVEALERDGTFDLLRSKRRPIHVAASPALRMSARVMAPVIMGDAYFGYISVAQAARSLDRTDLMAVEHAATVAALIIGREQAVSAHERSLRSVFVYESIFGNEPSDVMDRRARYLGYDPADGYAVLVARAAAVDRDGARRAMENIAIALDEAIATDTRRVGLSTIVADDLAVALVPAREAGTPSGWRARTEHFMRGVLAVDANLEVSVGIGRWYPTRASLRRSFTQARLAAVIGAHLSGPRTLTHYDRLGVYRLLADAVDRDALQAFREEQLGKIEADPDLIKTLRAYLKARGNKASCAKDLYVHLNTVKYRLARIADLTGRDLEDSQALLDLHIALEIGDVLPLLGPPLQASI
jgi:purine catabolism regulator